MDILYTKPVFTPFCKNGSLKYGGRLKSMVSYGNLTLETNIYGKTKQEAEAKFYKLVGPDATESEPKQQEKL